MFLAHQALTLFLKGIGSLLWQSPNQRWLQADGRQGHADNRTGELRERRQTHQRDHTPRCSENPRELDICITGRARPGPSARAGDCWSSGQRRPSAVEQQGEKDDCPEIPVRAEAFQAVLRIVDVQRSRLPGQMRCPTCHYD